MRSKKLAVIILDALDCYNVRMFDGFETLREKYYENGEVLGISTLPHTAQSNPMIWGGYLNEDMFWVKGADDWIDPAMHFDRDTAKSSDETELYTRGDLDTPFIWDVLEHNGLDACALQVPITLPPYSYNHMDELVDSWFPDTESRMKEHIRRKPEIIRDHIREDYDFIGTSIQMPDKWLHGVAETKCTEDFMHREAEVLDQQMQETIELLEHHDYSWVMLGDHGSPHPGAMPVKEAKELLPRHRKESIIFGNTDELPTYTDEIFPWMLDFFDVENEDVTYPVRGDTQSEPEASKEVLERLEELGYK